MGSGPVNKNRQCACSGHLSSYSCFREAHRCFQLRKEHSMSLFLTGADGFVGSALVRALVYQGKPVRALDNLCSGKLENILNVRDTVEFLEADILDRSSL